MNDLSFDDVVGWLQAHEGHTVYLEIGEPDPGRDDYDAIYAKLHDVKLGRVLLREDSSLGLPAAHVEIANLDGSRLIFDPARFVRAKSHRPDLLKVWMHHTYIALGTSLGDQ